VAQPRFLFVARARARSESWSRWQAGLRRSQPADQGAPTSWVAWRLVGANNRELGRSSQTYADLIECSESVARLRQAVLVAQAAVSVDPSTGCWYWRLDVQGVPIASAGRVYQRQRECLYSLEQFQRAAPSAASVVQTLIDLRDPAPAPEPLPLPRRSFESVPPARDGVTERTLTLVKPPPALSDRTLT
jgi:hypothetical protein